MGGHDDLKQPLVEAQAPSAPPYGSGYPGGAATGYPVILPEQQPAGGAFYPSIPSAASGPSASGSSFAPQPQPQLVAPPTEVVIVSCRHDHERGGPPERMMCGNCRHLVTPSVRKQWGLCSCITAVGLCSTGLGLCFWLPFCCPVTLDTVYTCPSCGAELYRRRAPFE
ncbi:hypothetical protein HXX76_014702 [Chlamydomonas incerta]|uniref:LITAF domain-containing protein n=1 Tax=Chlamydomonas incerta TaxID=51695 RepID=A0A835VSS5_CHLIN|nr:hypothetical protein HXX76_014702 [Chlamydomonas incerta]|eukprot:KAG2424169.1 hypothetical protein HXX76_014702 [Chlamydomonas incerta]